MTSAAPRARRTRRLIRIGRSDEFGVQQAALVTVVVLAPVAFLWCASLAGGRISPWLALLLPLVFSVAVRSDSALLAGTWLVLGVIWMAQVPAPFSWWSVPAAGAALLAHAGGAVLAGAPLTTVWPDATVNRTLRRIGVVLAITVAVASLAQATLSLEAGGAAALCVVALLSVAGWLWLGRRLDDEASEGSDGTGAAPEPPPSVRWDE